VTSIVIVVAVILIMHLKTLLKIANVLSYYWQRQFWTELLQCWQNYVRIINDKEVYLQLVTSHCTE